MKFLLTIVLLTVFIHGITLEKFEVIRTDISEDLHDIEFADERTGIVCSYGTGNIYRTTDGGSSWVRIKKTDPLYFEQVQFIDAKRGWICGERGTVYKTNDGGMTWLDVSIREDKGNLLLYGMCFAEAAGGYVSGAILSDENRWTPKMFSTGDGGAHWKPILDDIPHMILHLEKKENLLFGTGNGCIIRIAPEAGTWEYAFKDSTGKTGQIRDLRFADAHLGMAVSFNGMILQTSDGGNSFTGRKITENRLRSIAYLGAKNWLAAGDANQKSGEVIYWTEDNGVNWHKGGCFGDIHRIALTEKNIWIAGKKGLIARIKRRFDKAE